MTHRCNENETQSELVCDDLSDAPNTCDENEFSNSSKILELSDVIRHRRRLSKKYNVSSESEDSEMEADEPLIEEWTNEDDTFPSGKKIWNLLKEFVVRQHHYKEIAA